MTMVRQGLCERETSKEAGTGKHKKQKLGEKRCKTQKVKVKKLLASVNQPRDHKYVLDMYYRVGLSLSLILVGGLLPLISARGSSGKGFSSTKDFSSTKSSSGRGSFLTMSLIRIFLGCEAKGFSSTRDFSTRGFSTGGFLTGGFLLGMVFCRGLLLLTGLIRGSLLTMSLIRIFLGCEAGSDCPSGAGDGLPARARGGKPGSAEGRGRESSIRP